MSPLVSLPTAPSFLLLALMASVAGLVTEVAAAARAASSSDVVAMTTTTTTYPPSSSSSLSSSGTTTASLLAFQSRAPNGALGKFRRRRDCRRIRTPGPGGGIILDMLSPKEETTTFASRRAMMMIVLRERNRMAAMTVRRPRRSYHSFARGKDRHRDGHCRDDGMAMTMTTMMMMPPWTNDDDDELQRPPPQRSSETPLSSATPAEECDEPTRRRAEGGAEEDEEDRDASSSSSSRTTTQSLPRILSELDRRGVRYAPDATRAELERLLSSSSSSSSSHRRQRSDASSSSSSSNDYAKSSAPPSASEEDGRRRRRDPHRRTKDDEEDNEEAGVVVVVDAEVLEDRRRRPSPTRIGGGGNVDCSPSSSGSDEDEERRRRRRPATAAAAGGGGGDDGRRRVSSSRAEEEEARRRGNQRAPTRQRRRRRRDDEFSGGEERQQQQRRRRGDVPRRDYDRDDRNPPRHPQPRRNYRRREGSDYDFDLSDEDADPEDYDSGAEIFVMGFLEAGRTAARLAADAVNPFAREEDGEDGGGDWWYDERRGRNVLDVDVLDFEPQRRRRTTPIREGGDEGRRRRDDDGRQRRRARRDDRDVYSGRREAEYSTRPSRGRPQSASRTARPRPTYRAADAERRTANSVPVGGKRDGASRAYERPSSGGKGGAVGDAASSNRTPASDIPTERIPRRGSQRRVREERDAVSRPIYGLYQNGVEAEEGGGEECEHDRDRHREQQQQWKDRLRTKFDAALGLQHPSSSSSSEGEYYDSWKTQMEGMDEGRKEALLRRRRDQTEGSGGVGAEGDSGRTKRPHSSSPSASSSLAQSRPRNNRRARMRASKSRVQRPAGSSHPDGGRAVNGVRSEEVPFWREGGTMASLLFDTFPSSGPSSRGGGAERDGRRGRPMRRSSLEQIILSPFGHSHTVTSLFLYVARSSLTAFALVCRWAGVRGTIPQPIVATTAFAVLVSARRGSRFVATALSLLAFRLVGEFVHGSLHGNEFWQDEYDFEERDWKESGSAR